MAFDANMYIRAFSYFPVACDGTGCITSQFWLTFGIRVDANGILEYASLTAIGCECEETKSKISISFHHSFKGTLVEFHRSCTSFMYFNITVITIARQGNRPSSRLLIKLYFAWIIPYMSTYKWIFHVTGNLNHSC